MGGFQPIFCRHTTAPTKPPLLRCRTNGHGWHGYGSHHTPHGSEFTILRVDVAQESSERLPLPERLSSIERYQLADASNTDNPRQFVLSRQMPVWTTNGRSFEMDAVAGDEIVRLNTLEVWEFDNVLEGDDQMAHPMHIHGVQFQVVERQVESETAEGWETVRAG